ncbi:MAG: hypothetical protein JO326_09225, partial [Acetobacteraceae bacterium]|nr:hypothetical protein [Acetobacteraceae bacterium]
MTRIASILLGALMLAFGFIIVLETRRGDTPADQLPPVRPHGSAASAVAGAAAHTQAGDHVEQWVGTILARPLFEASRRPPAATVQVATTPVLPRVAGVLVSATGKSVIFAATADQRPVVAGEGARVGAFTITSIAPGQVTIAGPDGIRVLQPTFDSAAPTVSRPTASGS